MKFYADSAALETVTGLLRGGLIAGVTTNPTILVRDEAPPVAELYRAFAAAGAAEIFFQTTGATQEQMLDRAERIAGLGPEVIVKVPATPIGFRVAAALRRQGTPVLMTAVYSVAQAVSAAAVGARYIAPYFGRLSDAGEDASAIMARMVGALRGSGTDLLVASVRTPEVIAELAELGVRHITANPAVLEAAFQDPVSDTAAAEFEAVARGYDRITHAAGSETPEGHPAMRSQVRSTGSPVVS
ncbi:transaldolase family protein [Microbacterium aquimaris]|uniref:transaldolase family protein n=1 Tax=Microbacterium aquimaris TaxID=459816 RepID=UPI002AD3A784|nr:transaldolase family protein [Microbacterium aquimaris]MDZ8274782.1 transaldolase family protein [Microbacterium aquimaris]